MNEGKYKDYLRENVITDSIVSLSPGRDKNDGVENFYVITINERDVMRSIEVVYDKCDDMVAIIRNIVLPAPSESNDQTEIILSQDVLRNFYFVVVAICHQTQSLGGIINGTKKVGWDYLTTKWRIETKKNNEIVYPSFLINISTKDIKNILMDEMGICSISNPEERVGLLRDIAKKMQELKYNSVQNIYDISLGKITKNLDLLRIFEAYSDPVRKKSLFFLSLMKTYGNWIYEDISNLGTPVDYHEIRGHLRYGTVRVKDQNLLQKIVGKIPTTCQEDVDIRQAIYNAIMYIAEKAQITPETLHYLFWNIFRNCCGREHTHCFGCEPDCGLSEKYYALTKGTGCIFAKLCLSKEKSSKVTEHTTNTHYY